MVKEIHREIKDEFYHSTDQPATHRLCVVASNRDHLRLVVRQRRTGMCGARLIGGNRHGVHYGFIFFRSQAEAWKVWMEILNDKLVLVFVQSETETEWAYNHLTATGRNNGGNNSEGETANGDKLTA